MCMCCRIKLGIIETHDSIPYKLLDKELIHPYTHIPLLLYFHKASFDFDFESVPPPSKIPSFSHGLRHLWTELSVAHLKPSPSKVFDMIISLFLANKLSCLWEKMLCNPLAMQVWLYYMNINTKTVLAEEWAVSCLLIALTPLPDCINNNQRSRLNIYEVYTALVRIQSRLSL